MLRNDLLIIQPKMIIMKKRSPGTTLMSSNMYKTERELHIQR